MINQQLFQILQIVNYISEGSLLKWWDKIFSLLDTPKIKGKPRCKMIKLELSFDYLKRTKGSERNNAENETKSSFWETRIF